MFTDFQHDPHFTSFTTNLSEFAWKNQLVGMTADGLLYVDEKISRKGYYEFFPKLLPWDEVTEVQTARCVSGKGIVLGAASLFIGICAFSAGWIKGTHTGPGIFAIPLVGVLVGVIFLVGARRNSIKVYSHATCFHWMSQPLAYKATLPLCAKVIDSCRRHGIECVSHVSDAGT